MTRGQHQGKQKEFVLSNLFYPYFVLRYYQGIAQFLAECKETRGPLLTAPVRQNKWPDIEDV